MLFKWINENNKNISYMYIYFLIQLYAVENEKQNVF